MKKTVICVLLAAVMLFGAWMPSATAEQPAAAQQDVEALAALDEGLGYWFGTGEAGYDKAQALSALRKAAALGSGDAYYWLGMIEGYGLDPYRAETMMRYYQKAAELGSPLGLYGQGRLYMQGYGVTQDYRKAQELFQQAVDAGCLLAWRGLGNLYEEGLGVEADSAKGLACYEAQLASDDWHTRNLARCTLGLIFCFGRDGIEPDVEKGLAYLMQAADEGYIDAYNTLSDLYTDGEIVEKDYEQALAWAEKEAACGSYFDLGWLYSEEDLPACDYAYAAELLRKDIESGKTPLDSMACLAYLYSNGYGVETDVQACIDLCQKGLAAAGPSDGRLVEYFAYLLDWFNVEHTEPTVEGTYYFAALKSAGSMMNAEELGVSGSLTLEDGGSGHMVLNGDEDTITWEEADGVIKIVDSAGVSLDCLWKDGLLEIDAEEGYILCFVHEHADTDPGPHSLLRSVYAAIDGANGAHLSYECHMDYMDAVTVYDTHSRGGQFYGEKTLQVNGVESTSATCCLDGKIYSLDPGEKTGQYVTSSSAMAANTLLLDELYQMLYQYGHMTDFEIEMCELNGVVYTAEAYAAEDTAAAVFFFDDAGALAFVYKEAPPSSPEMGESVYIVSAIDGAVNEALFDLSAYAITE